MGALRRPTRENSDRAVPADVPALSSAYYRAVALTCTLPNRLNLFSRPVLRPFFRPRKRRLPGGGVWGTGLRGIQLGLLFGARSGATNLDCGLGHLVRPLAVVPLPNIPLLVS